MVSGGRSLAPNEESVRLLTCSSRHQPLRVSLSALGTSASGWFTFYGKSVEIKSEEEKKIPKRKKLEFMQYVIKMKLHCWPIK